MIKNSLKYDVWGSNSNHVYIVQFNVPINGVKTHLEGGSIGTNGL